MPSEHGKFSAELTLSQETNEILITSAPNGWNGLASWSTAPVAARYGPGLGELYSQHQRVLGLSLPPSSFPYQLYLLFRFEIRKVAIEEKLGDNV